MLWRPVIGQGWKKPPLVPQPFWMTAAAFQDKDHSHREPGVCSLTDLCFTRKVAANAQRKLVGDYAKRL